MPIISDTLLDQYDYASDPVLQKYLHAWDRVYIGAIMTYARGIGDFGMQMMAHQNRVSHDGARFLKYLGFSDRAARNYRAAMLFHDMGKTHPTYNPMIWMLYERPSKEEKVLQKKHARLGANMVQSLTERHPELRNHPHIQVRHAVTLYHHERIDGNGPEQFMADRLPVFAQISCIVDAYDGDMIPRPHQEHQRTPKEALRRMMGLDDPSKKYSGAFSGKLLQQYVKMKEEQLGITVNASSGGGLKSFLRLEKDR
jgi:HD-GYP domain-containing protein (c-di-GMP phosphodiesterase class II)